MHYDDNNVIINKATRKEFEMVKRNVELKLYAASKGVRMWQVAEKFGVSEVTMSRWMRKEFDEEKAKDFRKHVDELANEN